VALSVAGPDKPVSKRFVPYVYPHKFPVLCEVAFVILYYRFRSALCLWVVATAKVYAESAGYTELFELLCMDYIPVVFIHSYQPVLIEYQFFRHSLQVFKAFLQCVYEI
jgi:hypothetical protein